MKLIVDRIEGDNAVVELETGKIANLPIVFLPSGANEGDVIQIEINRAAAKDKRKQAKDLMNKVFEE